MMKKKKRQELNLRSNILIDDPPMVIFLQDWQEVENQLLDK